VILGIARKKDTVKNPEGFPGKYSLGLVIKTEDQNGDEMGSGRGW
jgi:hypothetical protein